jgi:tetratricopeptide (TPR) repeat protein
VRAARVRAATLDAHLQDVSARDITIAQQIEGLADEQYRHLAAELGVAKNVLASLLTLVQQEKVRNDEVKPKLREMAAAQKSGVLLARQAQRLQIRAVELVSEGKPDRALEELREGQQVMQALIDATPGDVGHQLQLGYYYKTLGQAYDAVGDAAGTEQHLDHAAAIFEHIAKALPADRKSVAELAGALNGLGNIYYQRGQHHKAIHSYRAALRLVPDYAYAWHDLFGAYVALAQRGEVNLKEMRHALKKVHETGSGQPGLSRDYLASLEQWLVGLAARK